MKLKHGQVIIYEISKDYLDYLRKVDYRVSLKNHRRFIGIVVSKKGVDYCIPLSTKVYTSNGKARNPKMTTFLLKNNNPIAVLLYNNMIPVDQNELRIVDVENDPDRDYLNNEIRYLHRNIREIEKKSDYVYHGYNKGKFMKKVCLNLRKLEEKRNDWILAKSNNSEKINDTHEYENDDFDRDEIEL